MSNSSSKLELESSAAAQDFRVIRSKTDLRIGEAGFITIQGRPGVRYILNTTYRIGNRSIAVRQERVAESNGQATFNWFVSPKTAPGTYSGTISGDGGYISISHTVIP